MATGRGRGRGTGATALDGVLDAIPASVALLDRSGRILFANRLWRDDARSHGFIGSNVGVGAHYVEACREARGTDPKIARRLARGVADILAGRRRHFEIEYSCSSPKRPRRFRCLVAPAGDAAHAAAVLHFEVTDRAIAEQEHAALGTFASGIAHDLTNLLLGMAGLLDAAIAELAPESAAARRIGAARDAIEQAGALARQILSFARRGASRRVRVDLAGAIGRALDLVAAVLPSSIALERHLELVGEAVADPVQLQQLALNLGANAVDAIGAEGQIRVWLERVPVRDLPAGLKRVPHARLRFADTGAGIRPEIIGRIFEPFFTTKGEGRGTGMGLAVVQGIVAGHGGRLEVRSEPGDGTELTIWLPLARPLAAS